MLVVGGDGVDEWSVTVDFESLRELDVAFAVAVVEVSIFRDGHDSASRGFEGGPWADVTKLGGNSQEVRAEEGDTGRRRAERMCWKVPNHARSTVNVRM